MNTVTKRFMEQHRQRSNFIRSCNLTKMVGSHGYEYSVVTDNSTVGVADVRLIPLPDYEDDSIKGYILCMKFTSGPYINEEQFIELGSRTYASDVEHLVKQVFKFHPMLKQSVQGQNEKNISILSKKIAALCDNYSWKDDFVAVKDGVYIIRDDKKISEKVVEVLIPENYYDLPYCNHSELIRTYTVVDTTTRSAVVVTLYMGDKRAYTEAEMVKESAPQLSKTAQRYMDQILKSFDAAADRINNRRRFGSDYLYTDDLRGSDYTV